MQKKISDTEDKNINTQYTKVISQVCWKPTYSFYPYKITKFSLNELSVMRLHMIYSKGYFTAKNVNFTILIKKITIYLLPPVQHGGRLKVPS